jgi:hypothetical protein
MDLRYPIGKYEVENQITKAMIDGWIEEIANTPTNLKATVADLRDDQIDTPYRPDGWTIRQVVHHLADSHINSYVRLKLTLTEDAPTIKPYQEEEWAKLPDSHLPIEVSLALLEAVHERWVCLLRSLQPSDLERTFIHPESGEQTIAFYIGLYAWHGRHHIAHITSLRDRLNW